MEPKDHILKAAHAVFARHGFRQTSMAMVAAEAGLSRQALYHHFASKEDLFSGLVDALHVSAFAAVDAAMARDTRTAADAISSVMIAYHRRLTEGLSDSPFAAELLEESGRQCGPAVAAYAQRFEKTLEALIARLVRQGQLKIRSGVSVRDLSEMVAIAAKGVKSAHAGEGEARYARALERMIGVICAGVEASNASANLAKKIQISGKGRIAR